MPGLMIPVPAREVLTRVIGVSMHKRVPVSRVFAHFANLPDKVTTHEGSKRVREAVKLIAREAIRRQKTAGKLALRLREYGYEYNYRTISSWARGDGMPPGDALLAIAKISEISIDEVLIDGGSLRAQLSRLEERLKRLESGDA